MMGFLEMLTIIVLGLMSMLADHYNLMKGWMIYYRFSFFLLVKYLNIDCELCIVNAIGERR